MKSLFFDVAAAARSAGAGADNQCKTALEADSSTSQKSRGKFWNMACFAVITAVAIIFSVTSCDWIEENIAPDDPMCVVKFDSKGGSPTPDAQTLEKGSFVVRPSNPTRANHSFVGWAKADNQTSDLWNFQTDVATANITLFARWRINTHLVTFDSDGGTAVENVNVAHGSRATRPANPTRAFPATAELYIGEIDVSALPAHYTFAEWRRTGESTAFNFNTPITEPITLRAVWTYSGPQPINISAQTGSNRVEQAFTYVRANPNTDEKYTLLVGRSITIARQTLDVSNVNLTIIGMGGRRTISFSDANGTMIAIGATGRYGISLTIGNNITLRGSSFSSSSNRYMINVTQGAEFIMQEGSEISGYVNNNSNEPNWGGYTLAIMVGGGSTFLMNGGEIKDNRVTNSVHVLSGSTFTMRGGEIKNNNARITTHTTISGVFSGGTFNMEGGEIRNNVGDLYISEGRSVTLSGDAEVGSVRLNATSATSYARISIAAGWTGRVDRLNFSGNSTLSTLTNWWIGKPVLTGAGVNAANVARFPMGDFILSGTQRNPITLHEINSDGVFVSK